MSEQTKSMRLFRLEPDGRYSESLPATLWPARDGRADYSTPPADGFFDGASGHALLTEERAATMKRGRLPMPMGLRAPTYQPTKHERSRWRGQLKWPMTSRRAGPLHGLSSHESEQVEAIIAAARRAGSVTLWEDGESQAADRMAHYVRAAIRHERITVRYVRAVDWMASPAELDALRDER